MASGDASPASESVNGPVSIDGVVLPTDYRLNAEEGLAYDPEGAANYLRHTVVGDPELDTLMAELSSTFSGAEIGQFIQAGMDEDTEGLRSAPEGLREFFLSPPPDPPWLDREAFLPGIRAFHRDSGMILGGFVTGVLVDGFTTYIAKSFVLTGRIFDRGVRRLQQNNRHYVEIFFPGGLERHGDGWKLSVRIRFIHAQLRHLLGNAEDWDARAWGMPISAAHTGYATACFSARAIKHAETLGVRFTREERDSIMAIWRYTGWLMGIPESILISSEEEALHLYEIASICEPPISDESIIMSNALLNSAPLVAGVTEPDERRTMAEKQIFPLSRALIGNEMADKLRFPKSRTRGVVFQFRMLQRIQRLMAKVQGKEAASESFSQLLNISTYDSTGIGYRLPEHEHSEKAGDW